MTTYTPEQQAARRAAFVDTPDVLRLAADLLERDGWCQTRSKRTDGSRCVERAIVDVSPREGDWIAATEAVARHLRLDRPPAWMALQEWNDRPYITQADVLAALRETAEELSAA